MTYTPKTWGGYQVLKEGSFFQIKYLWINPGYSISLQRHNHRWEEWLILSGTGCFLCGEKLFKVQPAQRVRVDRRDLHKVSCDVSSRPLEVVETWVGDYLSEDDIERFI